MATITVAQNIVTRRSEWHYGGLGVQRFLRADGMSAGERTAAITLLSQMCDMLVNHWSGGYNNANSGYQLWAQRDFAPTSMATGRVWTRSGSREGLDNIVQNLDDLVALRPNVKLALIMHDHPEAMLALSPAQSRSAQVQISPWPAPSKWGASGAGPLATDIINRYNNPPTGPAKVIAFLYGQELKGVPNPLGGTDLDDHRQGFLNFSAYMRANHPDILLGYPHLGFWTKGSVNSTRKTSMDALIAGGNTLGPSDDFMWDRLWQGVPRSAFDFATIDNSIVDYSSADTWRGDWVAVRQRISLEYHMMRVLRAKFLSWYGDDSIPFWGVESYIDTNQTDQDWMTGAMQAIGILVKAMYQARGGMWIADMWEPQGTADHVTYTPDGNIQSLFNENGVPYATWNALKEFRDHVYPGVELLSISSDDGAVHGIATPTKVIVANMDHLTAKSVTVSATGGVVGPVSVPALSYAVLDLPPYTPTPAGQFPIVDNFNRTISNSPGAWGTCDTGQTWVPAGTLARYFVNGNFGRLQLGPGNTDRVRIPTIVLPVTGRTIVLEGEMTFQFLLDVLPIGGNAVIYAAIHSDSNDSDYWRFDAIIPPVGSPMQFRSDTIKAGVQGNLDATLHTLNAGHGHTETPVASLLWNMKVRWVADGGAVGYDCMARVWKDGTAEPGHWCSSGNVATSVHPVAAAAGGIGFRAFKDPTCTEGTSVFSVGIVQVEDLLYVAPPPAVDTGAATLVTIIQ